MELCLENPQHIASLAFHTDWRVRYAAAVAIGETRDAKFVDLIKRMLQRENERKLYDQPQARFTGSSDDTSMAEQIAPLEVEFPPGINKEEMEDWRCRGRVKQALLFALYDIGRADDELRELLYRYMDDEDEDYPVRAAAARALARVGSPESIPYLRLAEAYDEWCTATEAKKAIRMLSDG